jgi:antitoxin MazE
VVSKVQKWGNSLAIRIPKAFAEEAELREGSSVEISVESGRIILAPAGKEWTLEHLVGKIRSANAHREVIWGESVTNESW